MLHTICYDGPLKGQFSHWQAQHFFSGITLEEFKNLFNLGQNSYGINFCLSHVDQRLLELRQHLTSAGLGIYYI